MDLFIADGYTAIKTIPAEVGLFPEVVAVYRPAPALERTKRSLVTTADAFEKLEVDLLRKHIVSLNGDEKPPIEKLKPALRSILVSLVLGYAGSDEDRDDQKN